MSGLSNATVRAALTLSLVQCLPVVLPSARCRIREMADSLFFHHLIELDARTVRRGVFANSPSLIRRFIDGNSISMTSIGAVAHLLLRRHVARISTLTRRARFTLLLNGRLVSSTRSSGVR